MLSGLVGRLNRLPRRWRWPLKWLVLAITGFLVSYPDPRVFARHVSRWLNPSALIQPDSPRLEPLLDGLRAHREMRHRMFEQAREAFSKAGNAPLVELAGPPLALARPETETPQRLLRLVEQYVYERIPYAFDWETWGVSDYLPTLDEVLDQGREDCDGRAVVAASLLARLGFKPELVADFAHVWVKTEHGDTMSPGEHTAVRATDEGVQVDWGWRLVSTTLAATGYGLAVFPLERQLIVLAVLWLLLLRPKAGWRAATVAAMLLVNGLLLLRVGGGAWQQPLRGYQMLGALQLAAGIVVLWQAGRPAGVARSSSIPSEVSAGLGPHDGP